MCFNVSRLLNCNNDLKFLIRRKYKNYLPNSNVICFNRQLLSLAIDNKKRQHLNNWNL